MRQYREPKDVNFIEIRDSLRCIVDAATDASLWSIDHIHGATEQAIYAGQGISHDALFWVFDHVRFDR